MKPLSKLIFSLFLIFNFLIAILLFNPQVVVAQTPGYNISCSDTRENEFNSLRPYQASPCGSASKAIFCSNRLTITESFDVTNKGSCTSQKQTGSFDCDPGIHIDKHDLNIEVADSDFPIFGNTEDSLDDAQKVNEYASWYLSGINDKLENKDATDEQIVNFSGPVKKLIPAMIQDAQRIKIIESATKKETYFDEDLGKEVTEAENHDQKVVDDLRLSSWEDGDLSTSNTFFNWLGTDIWNKKYPPLPWQFEEQILYQKAYNEWQGKNCAILPIVGLQCLDTFVNDKWADLWHYVPLSNNSDKKGSNYLLTDDGPNYVAGAGTTIDKAGHEDYTNANLFFAHTQEVKDLTELLNQTYRPAGYESESVETTEVIKKGIDEDGIASGNESYNGLACSNLVVRTNPGDDLFPGNPEFTVTGVEYDITGATCDEVYELRTVDNCRLPGGERYTCTKFVSDLKCHAAVNIVFNTGTKTPFADEIFADTVADSGSTFRKIFPKVEKGAPVSCIADIPAVTTVSYDKNGSQLPRGDGITGTQELKVKNIPFDGGDGQTELTFAHVGSVYEYFLKGIQTALRPQGYGEPIASGTLCANQNIKCGELPELPKPTGACGVGFVSPRIGEIPQSLKDIVAAAAETYTVSPGLILGVMYGEGAFNQGSVKKYDWTEENVKNWASCQPLPNCSGPQTSVVPFFDVYWERIAKRIAPDLAKIDPNKTEPDPCNLMDAVFALASDLHEGADGDGLQMSCFGIDIGKATVPTSCAYDQFQFEAAIKIWENGHDNGCFTKPGSCAEGGGNAALCPSGGDTCERYDTTGNTSHNACVWDVAHGK